MFDTVKKILYARNKISIKFPYAGLRRPAYFGEGELSDILSFGFSYVEHEDHCVEYLLINPSMAKRIIKEIESFRLMVDMDYFGILWTSQVLLTDKIDDDQIIFCNKDFSVILDLNTNKILEGQYADL